MAQSQVNIKENKNLCVFLWQACSFLTTNLAGGGCVQCHDTGRAKFWPAVSGVNCEKVTTTMTGGGGGEQSPD